METDDPEENNGRTLSLLTLADLAIALQDQGEDHNYARNYDVPQVLDEQCLLVKEKDHNYSTCSRTELRGRAKYNMKRSSSEENLTTVCSPENSRPSTDDFSLISKKSHSCEQVIPTSCTGIPQTSICRLSSEESDASTCNNKLCRSWPKENTFQDFMNGSLPVKKSSTQILLNQQTVYDHTYARDKSSVIYIGCETDLSKDGPKISGNPDPFFRKEHNYDIRGKFSFNDPQKMSSRKSKQMKHTSDNDYAGIPEQNLIDVLKGNRWNFDHNYTFHSFQCHQTSGSVESLDMDLSASDTDSCEETFEEESKLYQMQMINTQQDHPYSKSGVLSF